MKPTFLVKLTQMGFKVDMQPFDAGIFGNFCSLLYKFNTYAFSTCVGVDRCIENKSVDAPIPGKINKTNQFIGLIGANKGETLTQGWIEISPLMIRPGRWKQVVEFSIAYGGGNPISNDGEIPLSESRKWGHTQAVD